MKSRGKGLHVLSESLDDVRRSLWYNPGSQRLHVSATLDLARSCGDDDDECNKTCFQRRADI